MVLHKITNKMVCRAQISNGIKYEGKIYVTGLHPNFFYEHI